jgi:hypothetical protein
MWYWNWWLIRSTHCLESIQSNIKFTRIVFLRHYVMRYRQRWPVSASVRTGLLGGSYRRSEEKSTLPMDGECQSCTSHKYTVRRWMGNDKGNIGWDMESNGLAVRDE